MPGLFDLLTQLVGERPSSTFAAMLVVHIAAGEPAVHVVPHQVADDSGSDPPVRRIAIPGNL
jgi:hypothetical protein